MAMEVTIATVTKQPIYGLHGEFTVGQGDAQLRAVYLESKIKPGSEGLWDNMLASQLVPWREIFDVEKVSFDELLQRDLNDSRVAHDLIPYLIDRDGDFARFFPPILVVLVPKNRTSTGIEKSYPPSTDSDNVQSFGTLFDFTRIKTPDGDMSPFGQISYNPQTTAFVIVDGQHRAMAVLALHRQLTKSWGNSNYESYYKHISVSADDVRKLELPVCIVFFPELTRNNKSLLSKGITLDKACRELFLIVNRSAQPVSKSRNLLLDDEDFGALMMRQTLSTFKYRTEASDTLSRIYSFRYGDLEDEGSAVQSGQLEYSSAIALYKLQSIAGFANPRGFTLDEPADLSSGLNYRNAERPAQILLGTPLERWNRLGRTSAKTHAPKDVALAVELLGGLTDIPILRLFDDFLPFAMHNRVMRQYRMRLSELRSDPIQNRCLMLMYEGSGAKDVFEDHIRRLQEKLREDPTVSDYVKNQLRDGLDVQKAIQGHEREIRRRRACAIFNVRYDRFYPDPDQDSTKDQKVLEQKAKSIFDAISTQAFQIGFLTAVLTLVERLISNDVKYPDRESLMKMATDLILMTLNEFFRPEATRHETLSGLVKESRIDVFSTSEPGLRGLLSLSISELNERQWPFFRYVIYEILFSKASRKALIAWLQGLDQNVKIVWSAALTKLAADVTKVRDDFITRGVDKALERRDFQEQLRILAAEMRGRGSSDADIEKDINKKKEEEKNNVEARAKHNIQASVGAISSLDTAGKEVQQLTAGRTPGLTPRAS